MSVTIGETGRLEYLRLFPLYRKAFPRYERKPFAMIRAMQKKGTAEVLSIRDGGRFCGLVITMLYKDLVLVDYFAVSEDRRGGGIGSAALAEIGRRYRDKRIFLEIERPDDTAGNNVERLRRKDFYLRNGLADIGLMVRLFGVEMEVLTFGRAVEFEEYLDMYRAAAGKERAEANLILLENKRSSKNENG